MNPGVQELLQSIRSGSTEEWLELFDEFHGSKKIPADQKALVAGHAAAELSKGNDPKLDTWAIELFREFLEFTDDRYIGLRVDYLATLIHLLARTGQKAEAKDEFNSLAAIAHRAESKILKTVRDRQSELRHTFPWIW